MMGYMVAYRRSPQHAAKYHHEREYHLAWDAAEAVLLEGRELLGIQFTADSHPLTVAEVLARRDAKAEYCLLTYARFFGHIQQGQKIRRMYPLRLCQRRW